MSNPLPTVVICILYVYLVKVWGPNFMKDRKAIDCTRFLLWYNTFQVLLSTYIFVQVRTKNITTLLNESSINDVTFLGGGVADFMTTIIKP